VGVPSGPSMDPFVNDVFAHDSPGELGCIDADEENIVRFSPTYEIVGEEGGMAEFDSDFLCSDVFDEVFKYVEIDKGWWELEEIVMDAIFQSGKEGFEPLKCVNSCAAEFLEMGNGPMDFDDPCEVFAFGCPGFDHIWVGKPVEAHVEFDGVQL